MGKLILVACEDELEDELFEYLKSKTHWVEPLGETSMKDSCVNHYWLSRLFFYINSFFGGGVDIHHERFMKLLREWEKIIDGTGIDDSFFEGHEKAREKRIKERNKYVPKYTRKKKADKSLHGKS